MRTEVALGKAPPPFTDVASEIRLLLLHPGEEEEPISVDLGVWKLQHAPEFKAISYAWGEPEPTQQIYVDGKPRQVRCNCFYALWQARLNGYCSYVWMDALCINQQDNEEKGVQVQMMGSIYAAAAEVLASVGPGVDDFEFLFQFDPLQNSQWDQTQGKAQTRQIHDFIVSQGLEFRNRFWHSYYALNGRPYWNRAWIVQELARAKTKRIMCDRKSMSWRCIEIVVDCESDTYLSVEADEEIWRLRRQRPDRLRHLRWWAAGDAMRFSQTVHALGDMECGDPLDHIYALLGLIRHEDDDLNIIPDYSISPFELALQVVSCVDPSSYVAVLLSVNINVQDPAMKALVAARRKQVTGPVTNEAPQQPRPRFTDTITALLRLEDYGEGHLALPGPTATFPISSKAVHSIIDDHGIIEVMNEDHTLHRIGHSSAKKLFFGEANVGLLCSDTRPGDLLVRIDRHNDAVGLVMRKSTPRKYRVIGQGFFYSSSNARTLWDDSARELPEYTMNLSPEDLVALFGQDLTAVTGAYWTNGALVGTGMVDRQERLKRLITCVTDPQTNSNPMAWFDRPVRETGPVNYLITDNEATGEVSKNLHTSGSDNSDELQRKLQEQDSYYTPL